MRYKLTLAYDGRAFTGWQSQPHGRSAQDVLESRLGRILEIPLLRVHGAGRTDAGVHALGQVAHFDAPDALTMGGAEWQRALNARLPPALRVLACEPVAPIFNAQFDALGKMYHYRICRLPVLPPLEHGLAWHAPYRMDAGLLRAALYTLPGTHDFSAFAANRGDGKETLPGYAVRTLWSVECEETPGFLTLKFHGDGFLYKMVRLLTGSVMRVAFGRDPLAWFTTLLNSPRTGKSHHVAPAGGLYLQQVDYPAQSSPHDHPPQIL